MNQEIKYIKMDGTGNNFIIIDTSKYDGILDFSENDIRKIAKKYSPCDQVIVMRNSEAVNCFMDIYNRDGGKVSACGNATRCVGHILLDKIENNAVVKIETDAGILAVFRSQLGEDYVDADMGKPKFEWENIPLAKEQDTLNLAIGEGILQNPVGISMGNPHIVFFLDSQEDVANLDFEKNALGYSLENHKLFPERANIGVAYVDVNTSNIYLRVWERGAGETASCGTGACAAVVAAVRKGFIQKETTVVVRVRGGELYITWNDKKDELSCKKNNSNCNIILSGQVNYPNGREWELVDLSLIK